MKTIQLRAVPPPVDSRKITPTPVIAVRRKSRVIHATSPVRTDRYVRWESSEMLEVWFPAERWS